MAIMTLQPSRIGRVHGLIMQSVKVEMSLCLSSHNVKYVLAIEWGRPGNVCRGRDKVIRNLFQGHTLGGQPSVAPSYLGRN